jgi:hypothetical protein
MAESREEMLSVLRAMGYADSLLATFKDEELDALAQATIEEGLLDGGSADDLDAPPPARDVEERLSLNFAPSAAGSERGIVETLAQRFATEARTILADYGVRDPVVGFDVGLWDSSTGEQQKMWSVELRARESTLDLLHDELLERMGPALRQELDSHGCTDTRLWAMFANMIHYF